MIDQTEEFFIEKLKQGSELAFRQLISQYGNQIHRICFQMTSSTHEAEDLTQDVFISIVESIGQFKGQSKLSTWIHKIAVSKCLESKRSKSAKKRSGFLVSIFGGDEIQKSALNIADTYSTSTQIEYEQVQTVIKAALDQLPDNQRMALVLNKMEEYSYKEIADIMNISASAVESLLFRSKQNIKKLLKDYYEKNK
ncbi:MAG: RNA polymerase sigma factor [Saprospiraceae bacterium]|nr:RNA polymerase sigma factor [Saprospiraceae bacterium]MBK9993785.1 RNA polymerase sigma factor [Saprospiraceae bacterium]